MKDRRRLLAEHPPKRRLRKVIAGTSFVVFLSFCCLIPFLAFTFAVFWLNQGFPLLLDFWREQPAMRLILTGIFFFLAVGVVGSALVGIWFRVRSLQKAGFVKEQDVWPFGKRRWGQELILPSSLKLNPQEVERIQSSYRWATRVGFVWLSLWALFGVSVALATIIPLGLWVIGDTPPVQSAWLKFFTPVLSLAAVITCGFLGFLTGTPVAGLQ